MSQENRLFGVRLRAERARLKLTQAQVALAGGVSKTTQVAYEADVHVPDLAYVCNLEQAGFDGVFLQTGRTTFDFVRANFNWQIFGVLHEAVTKWSDERGVRIAPAKYADLMHMLYERFGNADEIDVVELDRALRVAA